MLPFSAAAMMVGDTGLKPQNVFKTLLAPASAMQAAIDGLPFVPDLIIDKNRVVSEAWSWRDSLRGLTTDTLASNSTSAATMWAGYSGSNDRLVHALKVAPKFLDIVTWSGNNIAGRLIPIDLDAEPGAIIVKRLNGVTDWPVRHRALSDTVTVRMNAPNAATIDSSFNYELPTSTSFIINNSAAVNATGGSYIAYALAHDPAGIIQCVTIGSTITGTASHDTGWPNGTQFALLKCDGASEDWQMFDTTRTPSFSGSDDRLRTNLPAIEDSVARISQSGSVLTFSGLTASQTYAAILIRAPI